MPTTDNGSRRAREPKQSFAAIVTANARYIPFHDDGRVGYECRLPGQPTRYLYLNPSEEGAEGEPNVFVYLGESGEPADDLPLHFYDVGEEDGEPTRTPAVSEDLAGLGASELARRVEGALGELASEVLCKHVAAVAEVGIALDPRSEAADRLWRPLIAYCAAEARERDEHARGGDRTQQKEVR